MNKYVISLLALVGTCAAGPSAADSTTLQAAPYVVQPAFIPLRFGAIRPCGWIFQQMCRDLKDGFAGHLDELCHEASSDIFASGRNRPGKSNAGNSAGDAWWNGETEGNWHCGHFMLACLTGEPEAMKKAKDYVDHILAAQDADGYLGIFSPELRYQGHGELWTQTCLFRGLLAYADATGDEKVFVAVQRAVDRTIAGYAGCRQIAFAQHDPMFTDVLEQLYARTGDRKYLDFGLRLYRECPNLKAFLQSPEVRQPSGQTVFNACYSNGHGATVTEVMRIPLWLWNATGDEEFLRLGRGVVSAMDHWVMPSGALVSMEAWTAGRSRGTWGTSTARSSSGNSRCSAPRRNSAMPPTPTRWSISGSTPPKAPGFRTAPRSSICPQRTACRSMTILTAASVSRPRIGIGPSAATPTPRVSHPITPPEYGCAPAGRAGHRRRLYGPSQMTAEIAGAAVSIEQKTLYPYSGEVELTVCPAKPATFCLWLLNPSWSRATRIACPCAEASGWRLLAGA